MGNRLDRFIGYFNPKAGAQRAAYRSRMDILEGSRGYEGASSGRLAANWYAPSTSPDAEIGKAAPKLRDRSRDAVRNNPLATKIVNTHANYMVGFGIMPRCNDDAVNKLFDEWSKKAFAGMAVDFYGACYTLAKMMVRDGEVYIRKRARRMEDGFAVPLQLQILDADYCDAAKSGVPVSNPANVIAQGVEFDAVGNRRGYWLHTQNPKSNIAWTYTGKGSSFVPAEEVIHLYRPDENQIHGVPWLAPVLTDLKDLKDYELAENIRKKVESCMVGMVVPGEGDLSDPNVGIDEPLDGLDKNPDNAMVTDVYGYPFERMEPGMFGVLHGGKDIKFNTPAISAGIEAYIRTRQRSIASGALIPYELMTGDYSQSNFASGKLGILDYKTFVGVMQWHVFIPVAMQVIWDWFIQAGRDAGKIARNQKIEVEWAPPEFESITRLDDARADLLEVRMGKRSMPEIIARTGRNPDRVLKEADEWTQKVDKTSSKLIFDSDPRKVSVNGQLQGEPAEEGKNGDGTNAKGP